MAFKITAVAATNAEDAKGDGELPSFDVDVKRFYLPGISLEGECPKCGEPYEQDFGDEYLSYPVANEPFEESCGCRSCDHQFKVKLQLNISLSVVG